MAQGITITRDKPKKFGRTRSVSHTLEHNFKQMLAEKMGVHFPDVIDAMTAMAKGYEQQRVLDDGTIKVDKSKPDVQAGKLLFEYTIQKPAQKVVHSGGMGIVHLVAQLEDGDDNTTQET